MRLYHKILIGIGATLGGFGMIAVLLMGGSWSMVVVGQISLDAYDQQESCSVALKNKVGPIWSDEKTTRDVGAPQNVLSGEPFTIEFILHGPGSRPHWLEITCPGYDLHKSDVFLAPNKVSSNIDLKNVEMKTSEPITDEQRWHKMMEQAKQEEVVEVERTARSKERAKRAALATWLQENFDEVASRLGHYYCFDPDNKKAAKTKPGSVAFEAIVMERSIVLFADYKNGAENTYEIRLKVISPGEHQGKYIHLSALRVLPGPEPSWMNGSELGNLVNLSIAKKRLQTEWTEPLELDITQVRVSRHRELCVQPR